MPRFEKSRENTLEMGGEQVQLLKKLGNIRTNEYLKEIFLKFLQILKFYTQKKTKIQCLFSKNVKNYKQKWGQFTVGREMAQHILVENI